MRTVSIALFVGLSVSAALAQSYPTSESQKRHLLLPYIMSATSCIASATRRDADFNFAVSTNNFAPVIARGWQTCLPQLNAMAQAHDQIYGYGGVDFAKGAYSDDLERAVRKVLARDIETERAVLDQEENDRRAAEARAAAERLDAERREQEARTEKAALLEKSRDLIRDRVLACIGREGASMVLTDEKAEVVAKASMVFCQKEVDALVQSSIEIAEAQSGPAASAQVLHEAMEKNVLDVVTAYVVKARGELIQKSLKPPPAPTPQQQGGPPA
jgi:hypothetical protein